MNIDPKDLEARLQPFLPTFAQALARVLESAAKNGRGGMTSWPVKVKVDKEGVHVIAVSTLKTKEPKGVRVDITAQSDDEEIGCWKIDEDPGQERVPGVMA